MPVIYRFSTCAILIYPREHNPPHFHVRSNDGREALVEIATLELLSYGIPRRELKEVLSWAEANRLVLKDKFKEYNP